MANLVDRADELQRRRRVLGLPLAVLYKFFDDQGNYLAVIVTYYAFVSIFPVLLIASSVLGFVLQGDNQLKTELLATALRQFPIVGSQLGRPEGLQGSAGAVVVGVVTAIYGVLGLGQATLNSVNVAWAVPRNSRFNPFVSRLRSFLVLIVAGLTVLLVAVLSSLGSNLDVFGQGVDVGVQWTVRILTIALNALVLSLLLKLATPHRLSFRSALPGGVFVALMWQLLQQLGGAYVNHVIGKVSQMNGVFALVLGLVALLYVASIVAVLGLEINVVLVQRLYPRALLTPFTDAVRLTDADRRAYEGYAKAQRHKGFEKVSVSFAPSPRQTRPEPEPEPLPRPEPEPAGVDQPDLGARRPAR